MDLETIKKYDDSVWLYFLKQRTVFDTDLIKSQKDWLIEQAETLHWLKKTLLENYNEGMVTKETIGKLLKKLNA